LPRTISKNEKYRFYVFRHRKRGDPDAVAVNEYNIYIRARKTKFSQIYGGEKLFIKLCVNWPNSLYSSSCYASHARDTTLSARVGTNSCNSSRVYHCARTVYFYYILFINIVVGVCTGVYRTVTDIEISLSGGQMRVHASPFREGFYRHRYKWDITNDHTVYCTTVITTFVPVTTCIIIDRFSVLCSPRRFSSPWPSSACTPLPPKSHPPTLTKPQEWRNTPTSPPQLVSIYNFLLPENLNTSFSVLEYYKF
jgi:hypothetical protein